MKRYWFMVAAATMTLTILIIALNNGYRIPRKYLYTMKEHETVVKEVKLFNMSYFIGDDMRIYGYGRNKNGHNRLYQTKLDDGKPPSIVTLPNALKEIHIGEVKGVVLNGRPYLYVHTWGGLVNINNFSFNIPQESKRLFFQSRYKNYLWAIGTQTVVPLHYDVPPGNGRTHKNFLLFEHREPMKKNRHLVVTSVTPHIIYEVDLGSGYMRPYSKTENPLASHFDPKYHLFLSGGPIQLVDRQCYLVAGHMANGGWGGIRMTFFYTFRDQYPFDILAVSKPIHFGYSRRLEYMNQIFLDRGKIYMSLGIDDDYTVLIRTPLSNILNALLPISK